jgi:hypothetical protein
VRPKASRALLAAPREFFGKLLTYRWNSVLQRPPATPLLAGICNRTSGLPSGFDGHSVDADLPTRAPAACKWGDARGPQQWAWAARSIGRLTGPLQGRFRGHGYPCVTQ